MIIDSFIGQIKEGDLLYSPLLASEEDADKIEVLFDTYRFLGYTKIAIQEVAADNDNKKFAKLQVLGELSTTDVLDDKILANKIAAADKQEKEKPESTFAYKSIEFGFFDDPIEAIGEFSRKLYDITNEVDAQELEMMRLKRIADSKKQKTEK